MLNTLETWAEYNEDKFKEFITSNLNTNFTTILKIIILALKFQPQKFIDLIYDFMIKFHQKKGWIFRSSLKDTFEVLFYKSYPFLSQEQKTEINKIIMSLEADDEKKSFPLNNGKRIVYYNLDKFNYLALIPEDDLTSKMKSVLLEGKRRDYKKDLNRFKGGLIAINPPLPKNAYEKMSIKQWEKSMLKYDKDIRDRTWGSTKGSLHQHARKFGEIVKENPSKYYELVEKIVSDKKVNTSYIKEGLDGLKEAKFEASKVKKLLEIALDLLQFEYQDEILRLHHYITTKEIYSTKVIDLMVKWVKETPDLSRFENALNIIESVTKKAEQNLFRVGVSSYVGNAVLKLTCLFKFPEHEEIIFKTLNEVLDQGCHDAIKACILQDLGYLLNLNWERTSALFLRIVDTTKLSLLYHGINAVQYLCRKNFELYIPYFEKAILYSKAQPNIATILSVRWIYSEESSEAILEKLFELNDKAKESTLIVAAHNLSVKDSMVQKRCKQLFLRFLKEDNKALILGYTRAFNQLKKQPFMIVYPLLQEFIKSSIAKNLGRVLYRYLINFVGTYPKECLTLMKYQETYNVPDMTQHGYYDEEPTQILIGAYTSLNAVDKENETIIIQVLDTYDSILKNPQLRKKAVELIEGIEM